MTSLFPSARRRRDYCWVSVESQMVWSGVNHGVWADEYRTLCCVNRKGGCSQIEDLLRGHTTGLGPRNQRVWEDLPPLSPQAGACGINVTVSCVHYSVYHCSKDIGALSPSADVRVNLPEDNCLILCLQWNFHDTSMSCLMIFKTHSEDNSSGDMTLDKNKSFMFKSWSSQEITSKMSF